MVPDENAIFILVCMFQSAKGRWNWGEGAIATSISQVIEFRLGGAINYIFGQKKGNFVNYPNAALTINMCQNCTYKDK